MKVADSINLDKTYTCLIKRCYCNVSTADNEISGCCYNSICGGSIGPFFNVRVIPYSSLYSLSEND